MSGIWPVFFVYVPDITVLIPDIIFSLLSTFRTSKVDVRNMDIKNWPYSGHQPGHIPDIAKGRARGLDPF